MLLWLLIKGPPRPFKTQLRILFLRFIGQPRGLVSGVGADDTFLSFGIEEYICKFNFLSPFNLKVQLELK